jgi:hypothetical protein
MKYLKYFENINEIDPFGEENWEEVEPETGDYINMMGGSDIDKKGIDRFMKYLSNKNLSYREINTPTLDTKIWTNIKKKSNIHRGSFAKVSGFSISLRNNLIYITQIRKLNKALRTYLRIPKFETIVLVFLSEYDAKEFLSKYGFTVD